MSFANDAFLYATKLIEERYGPEAGENRLMYHDAWHTDGVAGRARRIAEAMGLNRRYTELTVVAAAFHDTVQAWSPVTRADGAVVRQRKVRLNEMQSAIEAVTWMQSSGVNFMSVEYDLVTEAILVTIPTWDAQAGTVIQSALRPMTHDLVRAVALADIGSPGMDTDGFLRDSMTLFLEEQLDIAYVLRGEKDFTPPESYHKRYCAHLRGQAGFAKVDKNFSNLSLVVWVLSRRMPFEHFSVISTRRMLARS